MATITTTGTSLEILAPFFPYLIDVASPRLGKMWKLTQLGHTLDRTLMLEGQHKLWLDEVLPVLRPFSQLWGLLPDGTTPAIEFAKLCLGEEVEFENATVFYEPGEEDEEFGDTEETIEVRGKDNGKQLVFTIYPDWTWYGYGESDNCAPAAAIDYLRSKHFAVGLESHQYIAKSAGAPTLEKGDRPA